MAVNALHAQCVAGYRATAEEPIEFSGMRSQDSAGRYMIQQALVLCQHIQSVRIQDQGNLTGPEQSVERGHTLRFRTKSRTDRDRVKAAQVRRDALQEAG